MNTSFTLSQTLPTLPLPLQKILVLFGLIEDQAAEKERADEIRRQQEADLLAKQAAERAQERARLDKEAADAQTEADRVQAEADEKKRQKEEAEAEAAKLA